MSPAFSQIPLLLPRHRAPGPSPTWPPSAVPQGPQPSFCLLPRSPTCPGCACRTPRCPPPGPARMKRRGSGRAPRWRCPMGRPTAWSQGLASCTGRQVGDPPLTQPGPSRHPGHPCAPSPPRSRPTDAAAWPESRMLAYGCVVANTCLHVCSVCGGEGRPSPPRGLSTCAVGVRMRHAGRSPAPAPTQPRAGGGGPTSPGGGLGPRRGR